VGYIIHEDAEDDASLHSPLSVGEKRWMDGDRSLIDGNRLMTRHDCKPGMTILLLISLTCAMAVALRYKPKGRGLLAR
jgi:hypothetical protein